MKIKPEKSLILMVFLLISICNGMENGQFPLQQIESCPTGCYMALLIQSKSEDGQNVTKKFGKYTEDFQLLNKAREEYEGYKSGKLEEIDSCARIAASQRTTAAFLLLIDSQDVDVMKETLLYWAKTFNHEETIQFLTAQENNCIIFKRKQCSIQ